MTVPQYAPGFGKRLGDMAACYVFAQLHLDSADGSAERS